MALDHVQDMPLVGATLLDAVDALERCLLAGFQRLDRTLIVVAEQMRWTLANARRELEPVSDESCYELDEHRRALVLELHDFALGAHAMLDGSDAQIDGLADHIMTTLDRVMLGHPGYLRLVPAVVTDDAARAQFQISGLGLSALELCDMRLDGVPVTPENLVVEDDRLIRFELPLAPHDLPARMRAGGNRVMSLPLSFDVSDRHWFGLFDEGTPGRPYRSVLHVLPRDLGHAIAVFSGEIDSERRDMVLRETARGRGSQRLSAQAQRKGHEMRAARYAPEAARGGAALAPADPPPASVGASVATASLTAPAGARITAEQLSRPVTTLCEFRSAPIPLQLGAVAEIDVPKAAQSEGARNLRLLHVEICAPICGEAGANLAPDESRGGLGLSYDPLSRRAYLATRFD